METPPKFLCCEKGYNLNTNSPVFYFGLPDNNVYIVYYALTKSEEGLDLGIYTIAVVGMENFVYNYIDGKCFIIYKGTPLYLTGFYGGDIVLETVFTYENNDPSPYGLKYDMATSLINMFYKTNFFSD
jgi:hypothetical protein